MSFWGSLIAPTVKAVGDTAKIFVGDKSARDDHDAENYKIAHDSDRTHYGEGRTLWDSLIDGINRIPRPLGFFSICYYISLSWLDPLQFSIINIGLSSIPDAMWIVIGTVLTFYYAGRMQVTGMKPKVLVKRAKAIKESFNELKGDKK